MRQKINNICVNIWTRLFVWGCCYCARTSYCGSFLPDILSSIAFPICTAFLISSCRRWSFLARILSLCFEISHRPRPLPTPADIEVCCSRAFWISILEGIWTYLISLFWTKKFSKLSWAPEASIISTCSRDTFINPSEWTTFPVTNASFLSSIVVRLPMHAPMMAARLLAFACRSRSVDILYTWI